MTAIATPTATASAERVLRELWSFDDSDMPVLPVDSVQIAKKLGIQVFETELPDGVSAALTSRPNTDPIILLRSTDSINRKRFSTAHKLGHFMKRLDEGTLDEEFEYVDLRGKTASLGTEPDETYANAFAAALLMPEVAIRRAAGSDPDPIALSQQFRVSLEAMSIRLKVLGFA